MPNLDKAKGDLLSIQLPMRSERMNRVWFKGEMKEAILAGKKTATTRSHALPLGENQAVSGSRFKAEPFAILNVTDRFPTTLENVIRMFYREESFQSPDDMVRFLTKERLLLKTQGSVYFHRFVLVRAIQ